MNETDFINYMRGFAAALGDDRPSRNEWDSLVDTMNTVGRNPKDNYITGFYPASSTGNVKDNFYSIYGDKYGMENPNIKFQYTTSC